MSDILTLQELGDRYKQKFPDYSSIDSEELGTRVVKKHPEYLSAMSHPAGQPPVNPIPQVPQGTMLGNAVRPALTAVGGAMGGAIGALAAPETFGASIPVGGVAGGTAGATAGRKLQELYPNIFGSSENKGVSGDVKEGLTNEVLGRVFEAVPMLKNLFTGGKASLIKKIFPDRQLPEIKTALKTQLTPEAEAMTAPGRTYGQETGNKPAQMFEGLLAPNEAIKTSEAQRQAVKSGVAPFNVAQKEPISIDDIIPNKTKQGFVQGKWKTTTEPVDLINDPEARQTASKIASQRLYQQGWDEASGTFNPDKVINELHKNKDIYDQAIPSNTKTNIEYLMKRLQAQSPEGNKVGFGSYLVALRKGHLAISIPGAVAGLATGHPAAAETLLSGSAILLTAENFAKTMANPTSARAIIEGTKTPALLQSNKILTRTILNAIGRGSQVLLESQDGSQQSATIGPNGTISLGK